MIANLLIGDLVAKLCLTFVTPWNVAHQATFCGILQTGILEWVAMPSSRGSSQPRDQTSTALAGGFFTISTIWEALSINSILKGIFSEQSGLNLSFSKHCEQIHCHPGYVVPSIYRALVE